MGWKIADTAGRLDGSDVEEVAGAPERGVWARLKWWFGKW